VVPKHGHRIVDRNLLKRRLREVLRRDTLPRLRERELSLDVLIRTRRSAYELDFAALVQEVVQAVEAVCSEGS
jgi:ribonuclease P protein component